MWHRAARALQGLCPFHEEKTPAARDRRRSPRPSNCRETRAPSIQAPVCDQVRVRTVG